MNDVKVIPTEECVQQHNLFICDFTVCIPSAKKHKFIPRICTVKPAVAVTSIKRDPPLSGHFRVPPNDFQCKCTAIKRAPVQRGQRSAKFAPKR